MNALLSAAQQSLSLALRSNQFVAGASLVGTKDHKSFRATIAAGAVARDVWPHSICPVWLAYLLDAIFLAAPATGAGKTVGTACTRSQALKDGAMRLMHEMKNWDALSADDWQRIKRSIIAGLLDDVSGRPVADARRQDGWTVLQTLMGGLAGFMRGSAKPGEAASSTPSYRHPTVMENAFALELEIELFKEALIAVDDDAPAALATFFDQYLRTLTSLADTQKTPGAYRMTRENGAIIALNVMTMAIEAHAPDIRDNQRLTAA